MRRALFTILVAAPLACGAFGKGDAIDPAGDDDDNVDPGRTDAGGDVVTKQNPGDDASKGNQDGGGEALDDAGSGPAGTFPLHYGFEGGDCGWLADTASTKLSTTANSHHDGNQSCQVCNSGLDAPVAVKSPSFAVKKGHSYSLTGFVGPVAQNKPQTTILLAIDPPPAGSFGGGSRGMDSGPWTDFHSNRTVEADARMSINLSWAMPVSACVVIDDITVVEE